MKYFTGNDTAYFKTIVVAGELVMLNLLALLWINYFPNAFHTDISTEAYDISQKAFYLIDNAAYLLSLSAVGISLVGRVVTMEALFRKPLLLVGSHFLILFSALYFLRLYYSLTFLLVNDMSLMLAFVAWRLLMRKVIEAQRERGGNIRNVVILGTGAVANDVYTRLMNTPVYGYRFKGFFDDNATTCVVDPQLVKGDLGHVCSFMAQNDIHEVICALPQSDDTQMMGIVQYAENNCIRCFLVPDFRRFITHHVELHTYEGIPMVSLRPEPLQKASNFVLKRAFDIAFSLLFLLTIFPIIYIVCGLTIKITSPGPIFFRQKRSGTNGKPFYCLKFRSMRVNKLADSLQATKGDSRITAFGSFLRKSNLDETPQFINVLLGDMSVVGPRPHMVSQTKDFGEMINKYMLRHLAKPGITGWAQVTGCRGETRTVEEMAERVRRDVWYIENWSFLLDIRILFMTASNMLSGNKDAF